MYLHVLVIQGVGSFRGLSWLEHLRVLQRALIVHLHLLSHLIHIHLVHISWHKLLLLTKSNLLLIELGIGAIKALSSLPIIEG